MARAAREPDDDHGEVKPKDFATAVRLFRNDILPKRGRLLSEMAY